MGTLPLPGNAGEGPILPALMEDMEARRRGQCRTTPHPHPAKEPEAKCEEETGSAYTPASSAGRVNYLPSPLSSTLALAPGPNPQAGFLNPIQSPSLSA